MYRDFGVNPVNLTKPIHAFGAMRADTGRRLVHSGGDLSAATT